MQTNNKQDSTPYGKLQEAFRPWYSVSKRNMPSGGGGGEAPHPWPGRTHDWLGVPHPWLVGIPHTDLASRVLHLDLAGGYTKPGWGVPHLWWGYPIPNPDLASAWDWGTPSPAWDWGTPGKGPGTSHWGTP